MPGRKGKVLTRIRPATGPQLYRLNAEGLLTITIDEDTFIPGGPPRGWSDISNAEASALLDRLRDERYPGLGFPRAGQAWTVRGGLVVPIGQPS